VEKRLKTTEATTADILLKTPERVDKDILRILSELPISLRREPHTGLVMMTIADGTGTDFHLGEVLVTEAEVEYQGNIGYALVVGNHPEKALARAGISVVMESADDEIVRNLRQLLDKQANIHAREDKITEALTASTKVNFETMTQW
jgi:phosphonate C-P lyase system protein PhnG